MYRFLLLFLFVFTIGGSAYAQHMSDQQVVEYVKQAQASGKSQKQITSELLRRGVTQEQVLRIKAQYEATNSTSTSTDNQSKMMRKRGVSLGESYEVAETVGQRNVMSPSINSQVQQEEPTKQIFGHNLFTNRNLSFEPSVNLATPVNYRLGPGDEVIIDIWGASENTIRQTISPEGSIQVKDLGPVHLNGMTVKEANSYLQREFSKIYSGIGGSDPNSQIRLTLGDIRTIQINIMGEVAIPGTYTLSSFSTIFHALYRAGGVNEIGSLRGIKLVRNGKTIENLDVYEFIMKGKMNDDIRLQEGDVIIVEPYQSLVRIAGKVKRPMFYEMKTTETVASLLKYAGDFTGDAYKKSVRIIRKSGREHQVYNVDEMDYSVFRLDDADSVTIDAVLDRFENKVEISGAVFRPGLYQLDGEVNTVKQLIKKAENLRGDAFLNRAILDRERDDYSHEIISINLNGLLNGTIADIPLKKNDHLYIPGIHDLKEEETVSIYGEVQNSGIYPYSDKMTIEDLIIQSGGLLEAAATTRISVTRRIKNPKSTTYSSKLAETFTFDMKDGLLTGADNFYLQPFDMVQVRRSPAYQVQRTVSVAGEVLFSGSYALLKKNERLSDLIARAGGITPEAYIRGGRLIRQRSDEERRREQDVLRMARSGEGKDSVSVEKLAISETYTIGIDMEKALAHPGSDDDIVLREGDVIYIPEYINTVKISGSVMYPNTVSWQKDAKLKHYINMAGGYGDMAKKRKAYVVYLNGTVARAKKSSSGLIQPGCEIIVPSKREKQGMKLAEILGMSSATATMAAMVATLVNTFK
ncbi:SLBB domain-containing protein [uncultured Bacteroides sp.]|uniref:polysaccharide biosynthesis/export family protein n=1 Tax=uncultured Bacteroides sp. TaxID=162156 RepID=UPI0025CD0404|nr:SLBB domain-containing protein [uncultured Bacteroides sp.]